MCSLSASFSEETLKELVRLNEYRGSLASSNSTFYFHENLAYMGQVIQEETPSLNYLPDRLNFIHMQAPTSSNKRLQPAFYYCPESFETHSLWHNGLVLESEMSRLNVKYNTSFTLDTDLILHILVNDKKGLSDIRGSFSCVYYSNGKLMLFRNEISPLFYNLKGDISSTHTGDMISLPPNKIFSINSVEPNSIKLEEVFSFTTKNIPYYLEDE